LFSVGAGVDVASIVTVASALAVSELATSTVPSATAAIREDWKAPLENAVASRAETEACKEAAVSAAALRDTV